MCDIESYQTTRDRRASDVVSGLKLQRDEWPDFSDEELMRHFMLFRAYDIDQTGFITPENLFEVLKAMDVAVSLESTAHIVDEVAVLSGHDNDGKLSFRDFMHAIRYDQRATEENDAMDAMDELAMERVNVTGAEPEVNSIGKCEPEVPAEAPPAQPTTRARTSSIAALNTLAASRIKAFQAVVTESAQHEKLAVFRTKPVEVAGPMVNSDDMHKETLKAKVAAFEVAATYKGKIELRKTWKKVGGAAQWGSYKAGQKILLAGEPAGVAPKKKLSDLP